MAEKSFIDALDIVRARYRLQFKFFSVLELRNELLNKRVYEYKDQVIMVHNKRYIYNLIQHNKGNIPVMFKLRLTDDIAAIENRILNLQKRLEKNSYKSHLEKGILLSDQLHITLHYCYALRHFIEFDVNQIDPANWAELPEVIDDITQLSAAEMYHRITVTDKNAKILELTREDLRFIQDLLGVFPYLSTSDMVNNYD